MTTTNRHDKEAGSLLTFIIVGVALIALTLGGVYLAKQRGATLASNQTETTQEQGGDQQADENGGNDADRQDGPAPGDDTNDTPVESPDSSNDDAQQREDSQQGGNADNDNAAPPADDQDREVAVAPRTGGQTEQIPATGLEDHIAPAFLAFTALTYGGLRYAQSRRRLSKL